ncbi:hypothetical protein ACA910_021500 [Epithemia clementina (nom. ined.)]
MNGQEYEASSRIVEDAPRMRSMQVKPLTPTLLMPLAPLSKSRTTPAPLPNKATTSTTTTSTTTTHSPPSRSARWEVGSLEPIPLIYVLERTHVFCNDSAGNIAQRIAECLRTNSMAATFRQKEVAADVETMDNIYFTVRLWAGENGPNHVLVEVQKVSGCCYAYCQAAKSVLRAAKGITAPLSKGPSNLKRSFPMPKCIPKVDRQECLAATREGLHIAEQLLQQNRLDTRLLAMQSLEQLSRCPEHRVFTTKHILQNSQLISTIVELVQTVPPKDGDDVFSFSRVEIQHLVQMRRLAFVTLANCLTGLAQAGELMAMLKESAQLTSKPVLVALSNELGAASLRPHEACQAAECLKCLMAASSDMNGQAFGIPESLMEAQQVGACRHFGLERACTKLYQQQQPHALVE